MSLRESQYQIGNLKFGKGTPIQIVSVEPIGYEVSAGDRQLPLSDEIRFTKDYIQPGVIQFQLAALDNNIIEGTVEEVEQLGYALQSGHDLLENLKREWMANDIRTEWGVVKPLTYKAAGFSRMVFGRPRNFASARLRARPGWYGVTASYQLADPYSYDQEVQEELVPPTSSGAMGGAITRLGGTAPTWLQVFVVGPINAPKIVIGDMTIDFNYNIPAGQVVEFNSLPWERRCVSSTGLNLGAKMIGTSPYLEDLRFAADEEWDIALHGTGTTGATRLLVQWREAHHAI